MGSTLSVSVSRHVGAHLPHSPTLRRIRPHHSPGSTTTKGLESETNPKKGQGVKNKDPTP